MGEEETERQTERQRERDCRRRWGREGEIAGEGGERERDGGCEEWGWRENESMNELYFTRVAEKTITNPFTAAMMLLENEQ